ncbi:MAG: double-strand break repair protein AddB [Pseudomonadota bacterium]
MGERREPAVYTIPAHRAFADALVSGLLATHSDDRLALARGIILVPNNRAGLSIRNAFVRRAEHGLLLPRLVSVGDVESDEGAGLVFDPADAEPIAPAIEPLQRQLILAQMIQQQAAFTGHVTADQAMRLAADLARVLDQMLVEQVDPAALREAATELLSGHWQKSLDTLNIILESWPQALAARGQIDLATRRNAQLARMAARWRDTPPPGFVVAAGISTIAPASAALMKCVAYLPKGQVVLAGLDLAMPDEEWDAIGGSEDTPPIETHPQHQLRRLLDRMGISRTEVRTWRWGSDADARAPRARVISNAMAPARFTGKWAGLDRKDRDVGGVRALELANPAEEAQAIAILLRGALEEPGKTAALVTPDRALAIRVSAHLRRWGIEADDSAGQPLSATPPGTLILTLAEAVAQRFAPAPLLALLKHPLVQQGEARLDWLDGVRKLDRALRGPRPAEGLVGLSAYLKGGDARAIKIRVPALEWWHTVMPMLAPLETAFTARALDLGEALAVLRETLATLSGDAAWQGAAGRAAAELFARLERDAGLGPHDVSVEAVPALLRMLMDDVSVRPADGGHPRISIWGLIEARLQSVQMMVLGGLNEGVWPALPAPDPWLAPQIRKSLGLPGLEQRIGVAGHDLAGALGAPEVIMTRARRDASAPTIASRFWLRIKAMSGGLAPPKLAADVLAELIDKPDGETMPAKRPAPCPPLAARPLIIAATAVDRLKADPFSFYAQAILKLSAMEAIDAPAGPAWRGSMIHRVLQDWADEDGYQPDRLRARIDALLAQPEMHPLLRTLWQPKLIEAADFIAASVAQARGEGRVPLVAEADGRFEIAGVTLKGRVDRIDQLPGGSLAIVDYKTGTAPSVKQIEAGFALQLGLMGLMAENEGFKGVSGIAGTFEYWLLSRDSKTKTFGKIRQALGKGKALDPADFTSTAYEHFSEAAARWLTGVEPFLAKARPEYAPYGDYDQLMRYDEWRGRE